MGVTRTFKCSSKDYREEMARLQNVLLTMNASENGSWNVNITVMHHKNTERSSNLCILTYPDYHIAVLCADSSIIRDGGQPKCREIIQGDKNLMKVLENTHCFKMRQQYVVTGNIYQLGDFIFRIGIGCISNEVRCLICEVEFLGTRYVSEATPSIMEFMALLDPNSLHGLTQIKYDSYFQMNAEESSAKITAIDMLLCLNCISF